MLGLGNNIINGDVMGPSFVNTSYGFFDGTNDYFNVPNDTALTPNSSGSGRGFSVSMWVMYKQASNPARGGILLYKSGIWNLGANRYEYIIRSGYDQKPFMTVYGNASSSISQTFKLDLVPSADTWYHFAWCWDLGTGTTNWKCFVNGAKKTHGSGATLSSSGTWSAVINTPNHFRIATDNSNSQHTNLNADEYAIFDDFISDSDAALLYNDGTPGDANQVDNLVAYYRFEEGSGTSVADEIGSNDATLVNGATFGTY